MIWYAITLFVGFGLGFLLAALLTARARSGDVGHIDDVAEVSDDDGAGMDSEKMPAARMVEGEAPARPEPSLNEPRGGGTRALTPQGSERSKDTEATKSGRRARG